MNALHWSEIDALFKLEPVARVRACDSSLDAHRQAMLTLGSIRREAIEQMRQKISVAEIAELLGVSAPAIYKALSSDGDVPSAVTDVRGAPIDLPIRRPFQE